MLTERYRKKGDEKKKIRDLEIRERIRLDDTRRMPCKNDRAVKWKKANILRFTRENSVEAGAHISSIGRLASQSVSMYRFRSQLKTVYRG